MNAEIIAALLDIITPVLSALAVALGGWLLSKMPGPLRDVLTANVHKEDMARLVGAMQRRAMAEVADHHTPAPTAAEIVSYVGRVRGDLLAKMGVDAEALQTMAQSAIATATIASTAPAVAVPVLPAPP